MSRIGLILRRVRDLFFPRKCGCCSSLLDWYDTEERHDVFCDSCRKKWEDSLLDTCEICAKTVTACACVTETMKKAKCRAFRKLVYYRHGKADAVQNRLIYHIKHTRDSETPIFLARQMLPALYDLQKECGAVREQMYLTFLPRGNAAKLEYGVDQAEELARALSVLSGIPLKKLIMRRRGKNKQQKKLSFDERIRNANASFRLARRAELSGKTVFLVDDIVTTGAGMAACTRLLRKAGAKNVYCLAAASDDANREQI